MCLIVLSERGFADLPDAWIARVHDANPDGFGAMWHDGDRVRTLHVLDTAPASLRALLDTLPADRRVAIHFRKRTAGAITRANVHPFAVRVPEGELWLMHNGTLDEHASCPEVTDTRRFIAAELEPMFAQGHWLERHDRIVERARRSGSRFTLMDDRGNVLLVDGELSCWGDDGRWYSKREFLPPRVSAATGYLELPASACTDGRGAGEARRASRPPAATTNQASSWSDASRA